MHRASKAMVAALVMCLIVPLVSGAVQSPDDEATLCMRNNDIECAVEVWEREFQLKPFDPTVKETLFFTLLADADQEIVRGNLQNARDSFDRAQQLFPAGPARSDFLPLWSFVRDTLDIYVSNLFHYDMDPPLPFTPSDTEVSKSEYVRMEGMLADSTTAFAITPKVADSWSLYSLGPYDVDIAFRTSVFLSSQNGMARFVIGGKNHSISNAILLSIGWNFGDFNATWRLDRVDADETWVPILSPSYVDMSVNTWYVVELRARGKTIEVYLNRQLLGQATVFDYEPGFVGIAAELTAGGTYFTAAFDDIAGYLIAT